MAQKKSLELQNRMNKTEYTQMVEFTRVTKCLLTTLEITKQNYKKRFNKRWHRNL